jgi:hypothetical protein
LNRPDAIDRKSDVMMSGNSTSSLLTSNMSAIQMSFVPDMRSSSSVKSLASVSSATTRVTAVHSNPSTMSSVACRTIYAVDIYQENHFVNVRSYWYACITCTCYTKYNKCTLYMFILINNIYYYYRTVYVIPPLYTRIFSAWCIYCNKSNCNFSPNNIVSWAINGCIYQQSNYII